MPQGMNDGGPGLGALNHRIHIGSLHMGRPFIDGCIISLYRFRFSRTRQVGAL